MEHQIQQTLQPNSWLSDPEFIKQIKYEDKEYLSSLFDIFKKSFIFICPVKITAEYDLTRNRIAILTRTGIAGYLDVDRTVNPYDFCVLAKNLVYSQYPSYHVKYTQEIQTPRDPAEIIEVMEKDSGAKLEEIMHKSIPQVVEEAGVKKSLHEGRSISNRCKWCSSDSTLQNASILLSLRSSSSLKKDIT